MTSESENTAPESSDKELSDAVDEALAEVEVDEVAVLTSDLQRIQAEYSNYRKRVDRDRITANEITTAIVLSEFLPVLDDISRAEEHGELTGGFKAVADNCRQSQLSLDSLNSRILMCHLTQISMRR